MIRGAYDVNVGSRETTPSKKTLKPLTDWNEFVSMLQPTTGGGGHIHDRTVWWETNSFWGENHAFFHPFFEIILSPKKIILGWLRPCKKFVAPKKHIFPTRL